VLSIERAKNFYAEVFGWVYDPQPYDNICPKTGERLAEPRMLMFSKGPSFRGMFTKVEPDDHLSAAKHPDNAEKLKMSVRNTFSVVGVDVYLSKIEKAGGAMYV